MVQTHYDLGYSEGKQSRRKALLRIPSLDKLEAFMGKRS